MNKTILISGATSGFGKAIAYQFAQAGYTVCITGRRSERLQLLKADLEALFKVNVHSFCFDIQDKIAVEKAVLELKTKVNKIDILVNNAGLAQGLNSIENGDLNDWDTMIDTNLKGLLYLTRAIIPMMITQKSGHIINMGSTASKMVYKNANVYAATKYAVDALTQSLRIDLLEHGIKVTGIHPGAAETEFSLVRFKGDTIKAKQVYEGFQPLKPEDVADIVFYCTTLPSHVCINDLTVTCLTQANGVYSIKKN